MVLTGELIQRLLGEAGASPRLRTGYDLRTSAADGSQRMLNALMPGTKVPVHRHSTSAETLIVVHGVIDSVFYDDARHEIERHRLRSGSDEFGIQIPLGQWHTVDVSEPCVIVEIKDGAYEPLSGEDIL